MGKKGKQRAIFNSSTIPAKQHVSHVGGKDKPLVVYKPKKRRHDEGHVSTTKTLLHPLTSKVGPSGGQPPLLDIAPKSPPIQSTRQNIPPSAGPSISEVGFKTTMNIKQISANQFRFIEEIKPPDPMLDDLGPLEQRENTTPAGVKNIQAMDEGAMDTSDNT